MIPARPRWWTQVVLAVGFAWGYDAVRALHGDVHVPALQHAMTIVGLDRALGAGWIAGFSQWVAGHDPAADVLSGYYVGMHFGVVCITLIALWVDGRFYRWHRDALLLISGVAFVVFWFYPVAPPRLLSADYADSVKHVLPFAYHAEASAANLYAAVPSLHVAWALWCTIAICTVTHRVWLRILAVAHTLLTIVTVLATGNHYLVDVLTGLVLTALCFALLPAVIALAQRAAPRLVMARVWPFPGPRRPGWRRPVVRPAEVGTRTSPAAAAAPSPRRAGAVLRRRGERAVLTGLRAGGGGTSGT